MPGTVLRTRRIVLIELRLAAEAFATATAIVGLVLENIDDGAWCVVEEEVIAADKLANLMYSLTGYVDAALVDKDSYISAVAGLSSEILSETLICARSVCGELICDISVGGIDWDESHCYATIESRLLASTSGPSRREIGV